jgi:hypothetical protein
LLVFVFLLSGYFSPLLLVALFGASQVGVVLAAILSGLIGSATLPWGARAQWAGGEYAFKHVPLTLGLTGLTLLSFVAYPVVAGISYFGLPADELPARIFQYTLCVLLLSGYPLQLFFLIATLVSENLDEETRARFLVTQLASLVPNALWVALIFWSFDVQSAGQKVTIGDVSLTLSPLLIGVLIGLFVLTVLIPYLIGAQRAKRWRTTLLENQQSWIEKSKDILEAPAGSLYLPKLDTLQKGIDQEITEFVASDPMIADGIQIDQGTVPAGLESLASPYRLSRDLDPRFKHLDSLRKLSEKIKEMRTDLSGLAAEPDIKRAAKEWMKYLRPRKEELSKELARTKKTRTPAFLISSVIIAPIMSAVLSEFASALWDYFFTSSPPLSP